MTQIILNQPHTHAGMPHPIGADIDVPVHDAEYLVARGVANFKAGVQRSAAPNTSALEAGASAGEPVDATSQQTAAETLHLTDDTGAHHEQ